MNSGTEVDEGSTEHLDDLRKSLEELKPKAAESEMDHSMDFLSLETREKRSQPERGGYKVEWLVCVRCVGVWVCMCAYMYVCLRTRTCLCACVCLSMCIIFIFMLVLVCIHLGIVHW